MMAKYMLFGVLIIVLACGVSVSFAQETTAEQAQKAEQEAWMKASTPGVHHQHLKANVGSWEYTSKMWTDPSAPAVESKGTCERTMILGDRFLREDFAGDFMGMPFQGIGITGYDNVAKMYRTVWIDNMSTALMTGEGQCSDDGKTLEMVSGYIDAVSGKPGTLRSVSTVTGPGKLMVEYYGTGPDGEEFKAMEFAYTRK